MLFRLGALWRRLRGTTDRRLSSDLRRAMAEPWIKAGEILRGYDAARQSRRTQNWVAGSTSATAEITSSLATVRNRARDLVRNNPYAARAIEILAAKKIGTGIIGKPERGALAAWTEWVERCDFCEQLDFYGLQALIARTADESGECLVRRVYVRDDRVPLRLQVLEPDYLDASKYGAAGENTIIAGVEIDRWGRRRAYWLYDHHPGDAPLRARALQSRRVDASEVIHFFEQTRPGQLRGISRLARSIMALHDLAEFQEAELVRKKIEACFVAFVHGGRSRPLGEESASVTDGKRTETLAPGVIEYLDEGEAVTFGNPTGTTDPGYSKQVLHAIAAGIGVTYEQLTGDLSEVNYSSIRAGVAEFRDLIEQWRWVHFIPIVCNRVRDWFLDSAYIAGVIRTPRYRFSWTPPAWPYVNPVDDIRAEKEAVRGGVQSLSETIRKRGYEPDEVFAEIAEERRKLAAAGVLVDTDAALEAARRLRREDDGKENLAASG